MIFNRLSTSQMSAKHKKYADTLNRQPEDHCQISYDTSVGGAMPQDDLNCHRL